MSKLLDDLKKIESYFNSETLELFLDSGTLLGYIRNADYIPNDPDIDLSCTKEDDFLALIDQLRHKAGVQLYRYKGEVYKISVKKTLINSSCPIDIKLFKEDTEAFFSSPAIGRRGNNIASHKGSSSSLLRTISNSIKKHCDLSMWPLSKLYYHDKWLLPKRCCEGAPLIDGMNNIKIPNDVNNYLTFRYGNWGVPKSDWLSHRDDGAFLKTNDLASYSK